LQRLGEQLAHVHRAARAGLRRLDPADGPRPLHPDAAIGKVHVGPLQRECLAWPEPGVRKQQEQRRIHRRVLLRCGQECAELLLRHGPDGLRAIGRRQLVGAVSPPPTKVEGGVGQENAVIHGV